MQSSNEYLKLTREQLSEIVKNVAQRRIIGSFFIGSIGHQQVRWTDDGGVEVITEYVRGDWSNLPNRERQPELLE